MEEGNSEMLMDSDSVDFDEFKEFYDISTHANKELWQAVELLKETNSQYLESLNKSQQQLKELTEVNLSENVNSLYVKLKDKYRCLEDQYKKLQVEFDEYKENALRSKEESEGHCTERIDSMKKGLDEENSKLKDSIILLKEELEAKEKEFYDEMHRTQAACAFKYDEMESKLEGMLAEANKKCREANISNNVLRSQLMSLKNQFNNGLNNAEQSNFERIQHLEDKLLFTENQLRIAQEKLLENRQSVITKYTASKNRYINYAQTKANNTKQNRQNFEPETITINDSLCEETIQDKEESAKALVIKVNNVEAGSKGLYRENVKGTWARKKHKDVPASTNSSASIGNNSNASMKKKRKMYDPNNLDFLNDLGLNQDKDKN